MTLVYLPTKDLTRVLRVSKHWQTTILGSTFLRQELFLDSRPKEEYIRVGGQKHGKDLYTIVHKDPCDSYIRIFELHPALLPYSSPTGCFLTKNVPCDRLRAVHPSTLICQPPTSTYILNADYTPRREFDTMRGRVSRRHGHDGLTFGALLEGLDEIHVEYRGKYFKGSIHDVGEKDGETCDLWTPIATTNDKEEVRIARKAQVKAQLKAKPSAPPKEPSPEEAAILLEWLVETMDQLCPED
jgi:hypothetical protein